MGIFLINTIVNQELLKNNYSNLKLSFMLGDDCISMWSKWPNIDKVVENALIRNNMVLKI